MKTGKPRVGEIVELRDGSMLHGKKYLVVALPERQKDRYTDRDSVWWASPADGSRDHEYAGWISVGRPYVVVSNSGVAKTSVVPDDVDAKLERLRNDNLRVQFKYW